MTVSAIKLIHELERRIVSYEDYEGDHEIIDPMAFLLVKRELNSIIQLVKELAE
jgi:hypothetical protein